MVVTDRVAVRAVLKEQAGGSGSPGNDAAGSDKLSRPHEVAGPFGRPLTMQSLPAPDTRRWVVRRKAEVLAAIRGGLLTEAEACARYRLSPEELELWRESLERDGIPGLRVTRIQLYRDYPLTASRKRKPARLLPRGLARELGA